MENKFVKRNSKVFQNIFTILHNHGKEISSLKSGDFDENSSYVEVREILSMVLAKFMLDYTHPQFPEALIFGRKLEQNLMNDGFRNLLMEMLTYEATPIEPL